MNDWKDSKLELPPHDGHYEIKNEDNHNFSCMGIAFYDGYGFMSVSKYYEPDFWREIVQKEKRYGKIKCE